jgi:hypothetical protein
VTNRQGTTERQRKRRLEAEEADERERKKNCNDGRMGRIEEGVMEEGQQRKLIDVWWPRIKGICLVCFLLNEEWENHNVSSCGRISNELGRVGVANWVAKKITTQYEAASCCYKCSRPGDMCSAASVGVSSGCLEPDIIIPVVAVGWLRDEMGVRSIVESMAGREMKDIHDLFEWMMRRHYGRTLHHWGTRAFAVWTEVMIKNKGRFEEELESDFSSELESDISSELESDISNESDDDIYG